MAYSPQQHRPDLFEEFLVDASGMCRIVAYAKGTTAGSIGLDGITAAIEEYLVDRKIRKATYAIVFRSNQIDVSQIQVRVSNMTQGRLTCVWAIGIDDKAKSFFALHTAFKVGSTPYFENKVKALIGDGYRGVAERRKYPPWFEFLFITINPVWALSVYRPEKLVRSTPKPNL